MAKLNLDELLRDLGDDPPGDGHDDTGASSAEPARPSDQADHGTAGTGHEATEPPPPSSPLTSSSTWISDSRSHQAANVNPAGAPVDPTPPPPPPTPAADIPADSGELFASRTSDQTLADLYAPDNDAGETEDFAAALLSRGVINTEQHSAALRVLKQTPGRKFAEVLFELGVEQAAVQRVVAELEGLPFERVDFEDSEACDYKSLKRLGIDFCKSHMILPLRRSGNRLVVGTSNPDDVFLLDDVRRRLNVSSIKHVLVTTYDILGVLETFTESEAEEYNVEELLSDVDEDDVEVVKEDKQDVSEDDAESSPVVKYVNHIIQTAMKEGASDIHIEPDEKTLKVRFRIDGVLFEMMTPPRKMHAAITSRLKIMANLDIAERRLPQDGRIRVTVMGRKLDLRVSTLPTPKGEKTVMRILDNRAISVSLDDLGFGDDALQLWQKQISQPHGILLVTGPTGSGKTTTLYASIKQLDLRKLNVSTVEDPVEYNLAGITQIQTHERIGMTFAKALKALLRQDPDVIMLGEIRDMDTATIAIQAALTGHLVLSTLHTNDAPASVTRLINIGIEPFLVGAGLNAVLAQRLCRKVCDHCAEVQPAKPELVEFMEINGLAAEQLKYGRGCQRCRETGYAGRVGLFELLVLDDFMRDKIAGNPNVTEFRRLCTERGMTTLRQDGFEKVQKGLTTIEEILRVTQSTI